MSKYTSAQRGALKAYRKGFRIIALRSKSKIPAEKDWKNKAFKSGKSLKAYFRTHPDANFGILTGDGYVVIDLDGKIGRLSWKRLEREHGRLPNTVTVITPGDGEHRYCWYGGGAIGNTVGKLGLRIDIRGTGGLVVCAGSVHPNGGVYRYAEGKALGEIKIAPLADWIVKKLRKPKVASAGPVLPLTDENLKRGMKYAKRALQLEAQRVRNAPMHQANDTLNRAAYRMGQFLPHKLLDTAKVVAALSEAARARGQTADEIPGTIESGIRAGQKQPRVLPFNLKPDNKSTTIDDATKTPKAKLTAKLAKLGETDAHNARRFVRRYGDIVLWTPGVGWLVYDGHRWVPDAHNKRLKLAVKTMKAIRREAQYLSGSREQDGREEFSDQSLNKGAIDRMLALVQPDVAVDDDKLDSDPYLLNVANGTLDLQTGHLEKHNPADLITRCCSTRYSANAKCKLFKKFLHQSTDGNKDVARFLKKAAGYSLTGSVSEQVLFFLHGPHHTGKSTFINLIRDLIGDYAINTPIKSLLVKHFDSEIPVDIARMKGARIVTSIENNPNQQLDEAKIKSMTGGDKQTARFMRQNPFDFMPEFKLWIGANDLPRVRNTDDAIWGRFVVIPFKSEVDDDGRDLDLPKKLRTEFEGILAWAVRGALLWKKEHLNDKSMFDLEKNRWRKQSDTVGRFFGECCQVVSQTESVESSVLFARYTQWCTDNAERPCSTSVFKARLIEMNITPKRTKQVRLWLGVKLVKR